MSKTKHLDSMLDTFAVKPSHKRAARRAQVELTVFWSVTSLHYTIQSNGKLVESGDIPAGDTETCRKFVEQRAETRAAAIRALGKTVVINVY